MNMKRNFFNEKLLAVKITQKKQKKYVEGFWLTIRLKINDLWFVLLILISTFATP